MHVHGTRAATAANRTGPRMAGPRTAGPRTAGPRTAGFTLVEMLIAMALGLLLSGSLLAVFLSSKQSYTDNDRLARIQSNGRAALYLLANELRHVGFWSSLITVDNAGVFPASALAGDCAGWAGSETPTDGYLIGTSDPGADATLAADGCLNGGDLVDGASAVAIKRVSLGPEAYAELDAGQVFLRSHSESGRFLVKGSGEGASAPAALWQDWSYQPQLYFVRDYWLSPGDGVPALCAVQVDVNNPGTLRTNCLIEGVEDLNIEYGIDTSEPSDGVPDEYTGDLTADQALDAVVARISLLVRDTDADHDYRNTRSYQLGGRTVTVDDNFRRAVFNTTVVLQNQRNLPVR